ncbi:MAG: hypothetical protein JXR68_11260 [Bacteroidales bacterium]|nr:hypothetical protein [Bacteroidales bacterium]
MLNKIFCSTCLKYSKNLHLITELWTEIIAFYNQKNRSYHNFEHINNVISELLLTKEKIIDFDGIIFSAFYHDIIYNVNNNNNEELSAIFAEKSLKKLNIKNSQIEQCKKQILATKTHNSLNQDTNYLLDADLSILGKDKEIYSEYMKNIRKEYSTFSDEQFNTGRKKVIQNFINKTHIYKTHFFRKKYEKIAIINLKNEYYELNKSI